MGFDPEMCGQCPSWNDDQDQSQDQIPAQKLITTEECQRLKRDLKISFNKEKGGTDPITFLIIFFLVASFICITLFLLARAFIFKEKDEEETLSQDRRKGGQSSVDDVIDQLCEKCRASSRAMASRFHYTDELYVPARFWDSFPLEEMSKKRNKEQRLRTVPELDLDQEQTDTTDDEESSETTTETSDETSLEALEVIEESCEEEAESAGEQTDADKEQMEENKNSKPENTRKYTDSIDTLPTYYAHTVPNQSESQRRKIRWMNLLGRRKRFDSEV